MLYLSEKEAKNDKLTPHSHTIKSSSISIFFPKYFTKKVSL